MSRRIEISLSRACCTAMRGLAIVVIVFHNFVHLLRGTVDENEYGYLQSNVDRFLRALGSSHQLGYDLLSFVGWYGVPVFIFLTGYGLVRKYEVGGVPLSRGRFVWDSYRKLLCLIVPGVVLMTITLTALIMSYGNAPSIGLFGNELFQLTLLPDVVLPLIEPSPGVYWYFGLALQLYVIYALLIYRRPGWWMAVAVAVSLVGQALLADSADGLSWFRHNSTGWVMLLVLGVLYGRRKAPVSSALVVAVVLVSVAGFVPSMFNFYTWQLSLVAAVVIVIAFGKLTMRIAVWRDLWIWLGELSPYLFAAHPVVRQWFYFGIPDLRASALLVVCYFVASVAMAVVYKQMWRLVCVGLRRLSPRYFG